MTAAILLAAALWYPPPASTHGGPPLRFGVQDDPDLRLLSHVVAVYLREGIGLEVETTVYATVEEVQGVFTAGEADFVLEYPGVAWIKLYCPGDAAVSAKAVGQVKEYYDKEFPGSWLGLFPLAVNDSPCFQPGILASPRALEDLRNGPLAQALRQVVLAVDQEDLETLRAAGEEARDRVAAARALLGEKGLL